MRLSPIVFVLGSVLMACATTPQQPKVDASGLVRIESTGPGQLFSHPTRSIDHYDDILVGDVFLESRENPFSDLEMQKLRMRAYDIVVHEIPAAGQLAATGPGPCTVKLDVRLADLEFPKPGSKSGGATTAMLEFRDSLTGDPIVRYQQHRELSVSTNIGTEESSDLARLGRTLEIVADDVRVRLRDALPLNTTNARAGLGCKGVIGKVRAQNKAGKTAVQ
jgi:hypothetical protein